ncbi:MAG: folate-binding protein [Coxiellaceae bacterium]|nr:folate-binding protein [Coxiellaceae bacterium]
MTYSFSTLKFSGVKTQDFLQGQLTCDIHLLSEHGKYSLAACCDHRGRMIANFWVIQWHDDFLFILPETMCDITKTHLEKYAAFSKVIITKTDCKDAIYHVLNTAESTWHQKNIAKGLCILQPKTSLLFTPQMINLEKLGGVSFDKGCYVGQEIVARTEHLGTLKRHLQHFTIESTSPINAGDPFIKDTIEIGIIADAIALEKNCYEVLAVIEDRFI